MNSVAALDSFQLIVGLYLAYVAVKGSGTLYNFFDLPEKEQQRVKTPLRLCYGVCALLALTEAGLLMWQSSVGYTHIPELWLNKISSGITIVIVLVFAGVFSYLRKLANKE